MYQAADKYCVAEVASVHRIPVAQFVDPDNRLRVYHASGHLGPAFRVDGLLVWGFTGQVISAILDVAGWAQPWNTDDVRELDDAMALVGHDDTDGEAQL